MKYILLLTLLFLSITYLSFSQDKIHNPDKTSNTREVIKVYEKEPQIMTVSDMDILKEPQHIKKFINTENFKTIVGFYNRSTKKYETLSSPLKPGAELSIVKR